MLRRADVVNPTAGLPGRLEVSSGYLDDVTASRQLTVFYTALARALLFPRMLDETTEAGEVVHYSPYAAQGGVHKGLLVTDNGFWDTFRTVYPMLSIIYPDALGDIIQGTCVVRSNSHLCLFFSGCC
jgi:putative alpha-1,2-mannosidase